MSAFAAKMASLAEMTHRGHRVSETLGKHDRGGWPKHGISESCDFVNIGPIRHH